MICRQQHIQNLIRHMPERQSARFPVRADECNIHRSDHQSLDEFRRRCTVDRQLCPMQFITQALHHLRQPLHFVPGQEPDRERSPGGSGSLSGGIGGRLDLR
jgi:hypothetical protein